MAKYYPSQVIFTSPEERKAFQDFCKNHFGRSFSEQCRYMLLKAKREQAEKDAQVIASNQVRAGLGV